MNQPRSLSRRVAALCAAFLLLVQPALSTWSIVVVNTKTGEVCVGTATCLVGVDIQRVVPVIVPGKGAGASQSLIDSTAINRSIMRRGLLEGWTPAQILAQLQTLGSFQARQFGIVDFQNTPVTFTGNNAGAAKGGVFGVVGDLRYAIQGNVLTGPEVWLAAEHRLLNSSGDLGERVMGAMHAARAFGGDGRCSCNQSAPTSCGAPPPSFTKSAHTATVVIARIGDELGFCNTPLGCANGAYYLDLNFAGQVGDPDPVLVLQQQYDFWRSQQVGRPDQIYSQVTSSATSIPADGQSSAVITVKLADIDNQVLTHGGYKLVVEDITGAPSSAQVTEVLDLGNGTYTVKLTATTTPGTDKWRLTIRDWLGPVVLQPDTQLQVGP